MGSYNDNTMASEARATFDKFDKKKDGTVPAADCGTAIRSMGIVCSDKEAEERLIGLGNKGDGVSFDLFEQLYSACVAAEGDNEEDADLKAEFKTFDQDGDGKITFDELVQALTKMGDPDAESEAKEMFEEADSDGDGYINFAEFKNVMKS